MHNEALKASQQISPRNNNYNLKTMTKMTNSNVETKLLNECSIMDVEEINLREHLGPLVSNDVDNHMSKSIYNNNKKYNHIELIY
jgi:hypothetical protein